MGGRGGVEELGEGRVAGREFFVVLYAEAKGEGIKKTKKHPAFCRNAELYVDVWTPSICCFMVEERFYGRPPPPPLKLLTIKTVTCPTLSLLSEKCGFSSRWSYIQPPRYISSLVSRSFSFPLYCIGLAECP